MLLCVSERGPEDAESLLHETFSLVIRLGLPRLSSTAFHGQSDLRKAIALKCL